MRDVQGGEQAEREHCTWRRVESTQLMASSPVHGRWRQNLTMTMMNEEQAKDVDGSDANVGCIRQFDSLDYAWVRHEFADPIGDHAHPGF